LERFLPHLSKVERRRVLGAMWENIGRIFGELPHLRRILDDPDRFAFEGLPPVMDGIEEDCGVITITGHFGNWELSPAPSYFLKRYQLSFYRTLSNPLLNKYVRRLRERIATGELVPKGGDSLRRGMQALVRGQFIGLMADQRESKGIPVPFMGVEAPTSHAAALLALRYHSPLLAGIVIREKGAKFRMICRRIAVRPSGDRQGDVVAVTAQINDMFGEWIREYPEQWLWTHRRWQ
jgi:KDO2-lipid IV(A) lauroyltransferase